MIGPFYEAAMPINKILQKIASQKEIKNEDIDNAKASITKLSNLILKGLEKENTQPNPNIQKKVQESLKRYEEIGKILKDLVQKKIFAENDKTFSVIEKGVGTVVNFPVDKNEQTLLHKAILKNQEFDELESLIANENKPEIEKLLASGADVTQCDKDKRSPLHHACLLGLHTIVELLLQHKANIEAPDKSKKTPLHLACEENHIPTASLLLTNKIKRAKVNSQDQDGNTPLHLVCQNPKASPELVALLLKNGADIEARNNAGKTPLHLACAQGNSKVQKILIDNNAKVNAKDKEDNTPLHLLFIHGKYKRKRALELLEKGADVEAANKARKTPLELAAGFKSKAASLLKNYKLD
jgi:ankyrin repeat protein